MVPFIDNFLNKVTMYRLVLYSLRTMLAGAFILSFLNLLPHEPLNLLATAAVILGVTVGSNMLFAWILKVPTNYESAYITSLILILLVTPIRDLANFPYYTFLFWVSFLASASKYIFNINKKHLFNPAAIALVLSAIFMNQSGSWWVGTPYMLPFVLIPGLLVVRKLQRFDMVLTFFASAILSTILMRATSLETAETTFIQITFYSALFFFGTIMLTEPLTTPPGKMERITYGALVGFLFSPFVHIGSVYSTPELALVAGNLFSYFLSPKSRLLLKLKEKKKVAESTFDFIFSIPKKFAFEPGQYLEWTLGHKADVRGNRRYFTIASSPAEPDMRIGVKFYPGGSTFKKNLLDLKEGEELAAGGLAGEFTLPEDKNIKLVFMAGGIGITPFRSMLKHMLDTGERRDTILFYSNKTANDIAYAEILDEAEKRLGLKTVYTLTDENPSGWPGKTGFIDEKMIKNAALDWQERYYYISGTHAMVSAMEKMLRNLGIPRKRIKKDFFPGYA